MLYAVNIPSEIQLDFLLKDKGKYKQSSLYNLRSIVVHLGSGNDFGHYISLIKKGDKWFIFNDEKVEVRLFTDQQVLKSDLSEFFGSPNENYENQSSQCAYLLFYELVE